MNLWDFSFKEWFSKKCGGKTVAEKISFGAEYLGCSERTCWRLYSGKKPKNFKVYVKSAMHIER